jgi:predicted amino acid-binding ACT domain protein
MAIDIAKADIAIEKLKKKLDRIGDEMSLKITVQDVTIFKAMHRV